VIREICKENLNILSERDKIITQYNEGVIQQDIRPQLDKINGIIGNISGVLKKPIPDAPELEFRGSGQKMDYTMIKLMKL